MIKVSINIILIIYITTSIVNAQDGFQKWLEKEQQKFEEFKDKRDKAFAEFLEKQWRGIQLMKGIRPDSIPKPPREPSAVPKEFKPAPSKKIKDLIPPKEKETESIESFISSFLKNTATISVPFFNTDIKLNCDKEISDLNLNAPINENNISDFWAKISKTNYEDLVSQSLKVKEHLQLNDWGYFLLLDKTGDCLFPNRVNEKHLFIWFMLLKSSYDAKVCYDDSGISLLIPSENIIYGKPYLIMNKQNYYLINFNNDIKKATPVYTYEGKYPNAENLINMNIYKSPLIGNTFNTKKLIFNYHSISYDFDLKLKKELIDFYDQFPQTNLSVYFNADFSYETKISLIDNLKPVIGGETEADAVNTLLHFVQTSFGYKTDADQFGKEKPFFAEETIYYPYSDCEDRSVLFAFLVRELTGLDVIGLDFPGHIATAVKFSTPLEGDYIMYNGEKYIICDPTFINANIGHKMTKFKNAEPQVISLKRINRILH